MPSAEELRDKYRQKRTIADYEADYYRARADRYGPSAAPAATPPVTQGNWWTNLGQGVADWATGLPEWDANEFMSTLSDWLEGMNFYDDVEEFEESQSMEYPSVGKMASPALPEYTVAESGDTWETLGTSYGFDPATLAQMNPDVSAPTAGGAINLPPEPGLWAMQPEQLELAEKTKEWWREAQQPQTPEMFPQQWAPAVAQPGQLRPDQMNLYYEDYSADRRRWELQQDASRQAVERTAGENMAYAYGFTAAPRNEMYANLGAPAPGAYVDPRGARPSEREAYSVEQYDPYTDPSNKGRGAGIAGWIEERGGFENMRQDELDYLASHGFLVPETGFELPYYGGGYYEGGYDYPVPSYDTPSRKPGDRQMPSHIGLVSWSI